jgi:curved DNA-binding protein CbpA
MSLYDDLGVEKTASDEEIKAAYKRAAKRTHPDVGGNAADFEKIKLARTVLLNPNARKKYDETGSIDEDELKNEREQAFNLAMQAVYSAIGHFEAGGVDLITCDLVGEAAKKLAADLKLCEDGIKGTEKAALKLRELAKRFRAKTKETGNRIGLALETRAIEITRIAAQQAERKRTLQIALDIVNAHVFDFEKAVVQEKLVVDTDLIRTDGI